MKNWCLTSLLKGDVGSIYFRLLLASNRLPGGSCLAPIDDVGRRHVSNGDVLGSSYRMSKARRKFTAGNAGPEAQLRCAT